jgi:hypothetical protein
MNHRYAVARVSTTRGGFARPLRSLQLHTHSRSRRGAPDHRLPWGVGRGGGGRDLFAYGVRRRQRPRRTHRHRRERAAQSILSARDPRFADFTRCILEQPLTPIVPGFRASPRITALEQHSALPGLVWIAFSFTGLCGPHIDEMEPQSDCATIELLSISSTPSTACALGICALSVMSLVHQDEPG